MTWFRLDDQMPLNGKVGDLSDGDFRSLLALWAYCSRKRNGGEFRLNEAKHVFYATPRGPRCLKAAQVSRFLELGFLQTKDGESLTVNDWQDYQPRDPTAADRMQRHRDRNADRNDA